MLVKGGLLEVVSGPRLKYQTTDRGLAVMSEFKHHHGEIFRLCALIEDSAAENV
jgi:hypothetical protein